MTSKATEKKALGLSQPPRRRRVRLSDVIGSRETQRSIDEEQIERADARRTKLLIPASKPGRVFPGVGTGAVLVHDGKLLMVQRDGAHGAGTWSVPGGWVELWEHPFGAAEREVFEETGIAVSASRSLGWTDSQHAGEAVHAVTLWVECLYQGGTPRIVEPDKCPAVEWVPLARVAHRSLFKPLDSWWESYEWPKR